MSLCAIGAVLIALFLLLTVGAAALWGLDRHARPGRTICRGDGL